MTHSEAILEGLAEIKEEADAVRRISLREEAARLDWDFVSLPSSLEIELRRLNAEARQRGE